MTIHPINSEAFIKYGRALEGYDLAALLSKLEKVAPMPESGVLYVQGDAALEAEPAVAELRDRAFGGMPVQVGFYSGYNRALNCLEYHRGAEVIIPADGVVLLLAPLHKIIDGKLDTAEVEAFAVPAGTPVMLHATTLHYVPCVPGGESGFRAAVILPKGTNSHMPQITPRNAEDNMLRARNTWLLAHPGSAEAAEGAYEGLTGENIVI